MATKITELPKLNTLTIGNITYRLSDKYLEAHSLQVDTDKNTNTVTNVNQTVATDTATNTTYKIQNLSEVYDFSNGIKIGNVWIKPSEDGNTLEFCSSNQILHVEGITTGVTNDVATVKVNGIYGDGYESGCSVTCFISTTQHSTYENAYADHICYNNWSSIPTDSSNAVDYEPDPFELDDTEYFYVQFFLDEKNTSGDTIEKKLVYTKMIEIN